MKCCICGGEIEPVCGWTQGNDAWPVADGRCCDGCNMSLVVPARLLEMMSRRKASEQNPQQEEQR